MRPLPLLLAATALVALVALIYVAAPPSPSTSPQEGSSLAPQAVKQSELALQIPARSLISPARDTSLPDREPALLFAASSPLFDRTVATVPSRNTRNSGKQIRSSPISDSSNLTISSNENGQQTDRIEASPTPQRLPAIGLAAFISNAPVLPPIDTPGSFIDLDLAAGVRLPVIMVPEGITAEQQAEPAKLLGEQTIAESFEKQITEVLSGSTADQQEISTVWVQAQATADAQYIALFGFTAYNERSMRAAIEAGGQ